MMTSSNWNIFRVTGEFPSQRPMTRRFDVFLDLRLNKCLSKQSRRHLRCLWAHSDVTVMTRHRHENGNKIATNFMLLLAPEVVIYILSVKTVISSNGTIFFLVVYLFPECAVQNLVWCSTTYLASIHPCQMSVWVSFHFVMPKSMDTRARRFLN